MAQHGRDLGGGKSSCELITASKGKYNCVGDQAWGGSMERIRELINKKQI